MDSNLINSSLRGALATKQSSFCFSGLLRLCLAMTATTIFATSCTQSPAQVALKGSDKYGKNNTQTQNYSSSSRYNAPARPYSSFTPPPPVDVPQNTVQNASYNSIGISDLPPPTASASAKTSTTDTQKKTEDLASKPIDQVYTKQPINQWTDKPHEAAQVTDTDEEKLAVKLEEKNADKPQEKPEKKPIASSQFQWPVDSQKIISSFGEKGAGKANEGVEIAVDDGQSVAAAADGEVVYVGSELKGYGNMVIIKHSGNKFTSYGHLGRITVDKYARVKQGDIIGNAGATGNVSKPQLYFGLRINKTPVDPMKYMGI